MSDHNVCLDIQELAVRVQRIRKELDILEKMIQESLLKETHGRNNVTVDQYS